MRKFLDIVTVLGLGGICLGFTWVVSGGEFSSNTLYNFVFLGVIFVLYLIGLISGFFKSYNLTIYFTHSSDVIDSAKSKNLDVFGKIKALKGYLQIDRKLEDFVADLKDSQSGICEIEDYVNSDEVDILIHKWYLELVPDVMTSLGILGTFVGLVWGLRTFDPSGIEVMTSSVTELVNGIKVAFLTSIYGLVFSLVFSYKLNKSYSELVNSIQMFIDRFHTCIVPPAEFEAQNRMAHSQKGQYEILKMLGVEVSETMTNGFMQSLAPTMKKIDSSLDGMVEAMSGSQEAFMSELGEALRKIIDANDSNDRVVSMMTEAYQKNDELIESQKMMNEAILESQKGLIKAISNLSLELKGGEKNA